MSGFSIGFGVGLKYPAPNIAKEISPPTYLSCFATGIWEMEGYWFNKDTWKMSPIQSPFLPTGVWNNEGIYRFKDKFYFGMSFLPTGYFIFKDVYRFTDKIKMFPSGIDKSNAITTEGSNLVLSESGTRFFEVENKIGSKKTKNRSYWNF